MLSSLICSVGGSGDRVDGGDCWDGGAEQVSQVQSLPFHNIPSLRTLIKSIGAEYLRPDALPGVNHMRGMQYHIVLNITVYISTQLCAQFLQITSTLSYILNHPLVASYDIPG